MTFLKRDKISRKSKYILIWPDMHRYIGVSLVDQFAHIVHWLMVLSSIMFKENILIIYKYTTIVKNYLVLPTTSVFSLYSKIISLFYMLARFHQLNLSVRTNWVRNILSLSNATFEIEGTWIPQPNSSLLLKRSL